MGHEPCRGRSVPVLLPRLEEHTVAGPDHLDRPTTALCVTDALENVAELGLGGVMPVFADEPGPDRARSAYPSVSSPPS